MGYLKENKITEHVLTKWTPMPRYTKADIDDNRYSINRQLSQRLYLIVKDATTKKWKFPTNKRENPDTLRLSVEKKFRNDMKRDLIGFFVSHSPIGHIKREKEVLYFYHVLYVAGRPPFKKLANEWSDHQWVTKPELMDYEFEDETYQKLCFNMLHEGNNFTC
jgi:hypothetical protein